MKKLQILLWLIAISQFVLGGLTLFVPAFFFEAMGLSKPILDNQYMLAMLGARFVASGFGMAYLARSEKPDMFWLRNMVLIQVIDFLAGAFYMASDVISWQVAAFPMFNALIFATLLWMWSKEQATSQLKQA